MARVERWIGGPGTGKTRLILDKLDQAKKELGLSVDQLGFATFTRAGRAEIVSRASDLWGCGEDSLQKEGWFRTCHSLAYRQLEIADGRLLEGETGSDWLTKTFGVEITLGSRDREFDGGRSMPDAEQHIQSALRIWDLARSRCEDLQDTAAWLAAEGCGVSGDLAAGIVEEYETAKRRDGMVDYVDLLAMYAGVHFLPDGTHRFCHPEGEIPPSLRVLAIDEAQDSSALVDRVCRRLAESGTIERIWIVGDPYQSIHAFAGGSFRHFMSWEAQQFVMPKSYRCPRNIMELAEKCLSQMNYGYVDRKISHADHDGTIDRVHSFMLAAENISLTESTMILARCAYSLREYAKHLRNEGVPYCWIDAMKSTNTLSALNSLWNLEHGKPVHGEDWAEAVKILVYKDADRGVLLKHGEKAAWKSGKRSDVTYVRPTEDDMTRAGCSPTLAGMISRGEWVDAIVKASQPRAEEWRSMAVKHGLEAANDPPIKLSTIHSAKGLEADHVILSTQVSWAVESSMVNEEHFDEECRIAYVGVTRARHRLTVLDDAENNRMRINHAWCA